MPLLETKLFGAVSADGQLPSSVVSASTRVVVLAVTSSYAVAPWLPQGGCVWLVTGTVELPLPTEVGGGRCQRSVIGRCIFYSHRNG